MTAGNAPKEGRLPGGGRRAFVALVVLAATAGLLWRAVDLQVNHKAFLKQQGDARHLRVVKISAHRGKILDRNGEPLAISTPVDSVWANPKEVRAQNPHWSDLADLLGLDVVRVERTLAERRGRDFVYIKRHVAPDLAKRVAALHVEGVYLQREYRRYYPLGEAAAQVVGFTNVDDVGQEGLELAFDSRLHGTAGAKRVLRDRFGRIVEDVESIREAHPGTDVKLSIDARIQYLAYRALLSGVRQNGAKSGSAVVLDVRTGEVLAMVNQPSFNPNNRSDRQSDRIRNRAVTDVFEPGSTIKPFTIAAALGSGQYTPHTPVDTTPGILHVGPLTVHDTRDHGLLDVATVIQKSSNVGASKISLSLEPRLLWQTFTRVGFGSSTGSGFPGEVDGLLTHFFHWSEVKRATLSYGYGISVTPLQLAAAYAAIANGGRLEPVTFLRGHSVRPGMQVMSPEVAAELRRMLEAVITPAGTGDRASVPGYRVAGKTGTVHKSIPGGYSPDRYLSVFAGFAPVDSPRIAIAVVVEEPSAGIYYGGLVAAPVFSAIARGALRVLGVPPDDRSIVRRQVALGNDPSNPPRVYAQSTIPSGIYPQEAVQ